MSQKVAELPGRSRGARLLREVRRHKYAYAVAAAFVIGGGVGAPLLVPQAPTAVAVVGGIAMGLYAALCAVPNKFLD